MGRKKKVVDEDDAYAGDDVGRPAKSLTRSFIPSGDNMYDKLKGKWAAEDCYRIAEEGTRRLVEQITLPAVVMPSSVPMKGFLEGCTERATIVPLSLALENESPIMLKPFSSTTRSPHVDSADVHDLVNVFINAGGPVWATSIRPFFPEQRLSSHGTVRPFHQYIAIGTSRVGFAQGTALGTDKGHTLGDAERYDNMLQIWNVHGRYVAPARAVAGGGKLMLSKKKINDDPNHVPKQRGRPRKYPRPEEAEEGAVVKKKTYKKRVKETASKEAEDAMDVDEEEAEVEEPSAEACEASSELSYCVALKGRGPSWAVEWCPCPPVDSVRSLGVVAVVTGDGSCLILELPRPSEPAPRGGDAGNTPVLALEGLALCTVSVSGGMVASVAWSRTAAGQFACGMMDGSVTLWQLPGRGPSSSLNSTGCSSFNSSQTSNSGRTAVTLAVPTMHFVDTQQAESQLPCMAAVRAVQFCPYDATLLLAAGQDDVKIWSLKDYTAPVFSKKMVGPAAAAGWDACGFGYYTGDCETTGLLWNPLWGVTYPNICRRELYTHALQYGAVWALRSLRHDDHSLVLTAGSDGSVRGGYTAVMTSTKGRGLSTMELCRVLEVTEATAQSGGGSSSSRVGGGAEGRVLSVALRDKPTLLAIATGEERFPEVSNVAWQCIDAVKLPGPEDNAPTTVGREGGKKRGEASSSQGPSAEVLLVAYGSTTGLVRVHTLDPMRVLFAGTGAEAVAETKK